MDEIRVLGVLVVLVTIVTVFHPQFLSIASIANITQQASFFGIIALGMVFLLSMGELDLSVGGNFAFCAMVVGILVQAGVNPWLAALAAIAVGGCLGALNSVLSNALRVPIIVISLGTLAVYRGASLIISGAGSVSGGDPADPFFTVLGGSIGGIPALSIAFLVLTIVLTYVYTKTSFGFAVRAVGSNPHAARLSGYPINRIRIAVGALVGVLCGISGILSFAFFQASDPAVGTGYELLVVAAAVIGGTTLSGGRGSVVGAALGALIVSVINGALTAFGVSANYAGFVTGLVIVGAVALDSVLKRRKRP
jgi:ribose transport system permease protein